MTIFLVNETFRKAFMEKVIGWLDMSIHNYTNKELLEKVYGTSELNDKGKGILEGYVMSKKYLTKLAEELFNECFSQKNSLTPSDLELLKGGLNNWIGEMATSDSDSDCGEVEVKTSLLERKMDNMIFPLTDKQRSEIKKLIIKAYS